MSLTIDQQRQRVEQEMTRMVDDLDRTVLRKMQVIFGNKVRRKILFHQSMEWTEFDVANLLWVFSVGWNAFVCGQMLWWQKWKHRFRTKLYRTLFGASESSPTICPEGIGRISGTSSTLRNGKHLHFAYRIFPRIPS